MGGLGRLGGANSRKLLWVAVVTAFVVACTFVDFRLWAAFHRGNLGDLVDAARGVTLGTPHWRAYQSRLLGPYIIYAVYQIPGLSYTQAYTGVVASLLFLWNALTFGVFSRLSGSVPAGLLSVAVGSVFFNGLHNQWFYPWDSVDLIVFTVLVYLIYARKGFAWFLALFAVELTNREAALFIPVWIVLDSSNLGLRKWRSILISAAMLGVGIVFVKVCRDALWVTSMLPGIGDDLSHRVLGNHFYFQRNIQQLAAGLKWPGVDGVGTCAMLGAGLWMRIRDGSARTRRLMALMLIMLSSVLVLGVADEMRMYLVFIPLLFGVIMGDNYRQRTP